MYLGDIRGKHFGVELQKMAIFGTAHMFWVLTLHLTYCRCIFQKPVCIEFQGQDLILANAHIGAL
jgi:hypothetical protein